MENRTFLSSTLVFMLIGDLGLFFDLISDLDLTTGLELLSIILKFDKLFKLLLTECKNEGSDLFYVFCCSTCSILDFKLNVTGD